MTRGRRALVAAVAALALLPGAAFAQQAPAAQTPAARPAPPGTVYQCPMHPDVTAMAPGTCPRCGMALAIMDPFDAREFLVDVTTAPEPVRAGTPFRLQLTVREPVTRAVVSQFATVHDKRFHLFVISQDLEHYAHVHPEQAPDGSWSLDVTLPAAGYYKLYADFLPIGGTPQVVALPLVTASFAGSLAGSAARLVPDRELTKSVRSMRVGLALPEDPLVAGREEMFAFELTDAASGQPVRDIEAYLGAWGHTLLISEDTLSVVHAHPVELVPLDDPAARGGPVITFKALFPKPGPYRMWAQMQRQGEVVTAMFTVNVLSTVKQ